MAEKEPTNSKAGESSPDKVASKKVAEDSTSKAPDNRKWYKKKRWIFLILLVAFIAYSNSNNNSNSDEKVQPTETSSPEVTNEAKVPNLVGQAGDEAVDALEQLGFSNISTIDKSVEERNPLLLSNWKVCSQTPAEGSASAFDAEVKLSVVKTDESCDSASSDNGSSGATSEYGVQPAKQKSFVGVIEKYKAIYDAAKNDLQRGNERLNRDEALCSVTGGSNVKSWTGVLEDVGATSEGLAYLRVKIGDGVTIETWNNELSDFMDDTLVQRSSELYDIILSLEEGQKVVFSGSFVPDDGSCLDTKNFSEYFAIESPEFLFRFSGIRAQ
jgi:hypothetical protein